LTHACGFFFVGAQMPLSKYFKGKGPQVMKSMLAKYGEKKGKSVFYAVANKQKSDGKYDKLFQD
jgi:hypothetical protein